MTARAAAGPQATVEVRDLRAADLEAVARIDALHTGRRKTAYWKRVLPSFVGRRARPDRVGIGAALAGRLVGYLLGEVRAFEFGSEPCGWVFAIGVDPGRLRKGVASLLLDEACLRFREAGVPHVRTMVRRNDVPVMSFFRANGFVGGSFVQLALELGDRS